MVVGVPEMVSLRLPINGIILMSHSNHFFTYPNVDGGQSPASIESDLKTEPEPCSVGGLPDYVHPREADTEQIGPGFGAKIRRGAVEGPAKTAEQLDSQPDRHPNKPGVLKLASSANKG